MEKNEAHVRYSAAQYDSFTSTLKGFDDSLAEMLVPEVAKRPGATLLDVGTGTARFLIHLAKDPRFAGVRLVGTDLFADMISQAHVAVEAEGLSGIELLEDDVHKMRFDDGAADIIVSRSTIHHWSDPVQAFREIFRVLRPGGVAIIIDVRRDAAPEAVEEFNRMRAAAGLPPSFLEEKFTSTEVAEFLAKAGLEGLARVHTPKHGINALGLAAILKKPGLTS